MSDILISPVIPLGFTGDEWQTNLPGVVVGALGIYQNLYHIPEDDWFDPVTPEEIRATIRALYPNKNLSDDDCIRIYNAKARLKDKLVQFGANYFNKGDTDESRALYASMLEDIKEEARIANNEYALANSGQILNKMLGMYSKPAELRVKEKLALMYADEADYQLRVRNGRRDYGTSPWYSSEEANARDAHYKEMRKKYGNLTNLLGYGLSQLNQGHASNPYDPNYVSNEQAERNRMAMDWGANTYLNTGRGDYYSRPDAYNLLAVDTRNTSYRVNAVDAPVYGALYATGAAAGPVMLTAPEMLASGIGVEIGSPIGGQVGYFVDHDILGGSGKTGEFLGNLAGGFMGYGAGRRFLGPPMNRMFNAAENYAANRGATSVLYPTERYPRTNYGLPLGELAFTWDPYQRYTGYRKGLEHYTGRTTESTPRDINVSPAGVEPGAPGSGARYTEGKPVESLMELDFDEPTTTVEIETPPPFNPSGQTTNTNIKPISEITPEDIQNMPKFNPDFEGEPVYVEMRLNPDGLGIIDIPDGVSETAGVRYISPIDNLPYVARNLLEVSLIMNKMQNDARTLYPEKFASTTNTIPETPSLPTPLTSNSLEPGTRLRYKNGDSNKEFVVQSKEDGGVWMNDGTDLNIYIPNSDLSFYEVVEPTSRPATGGVETPTTGRSTEVPTELVPETPTNASVDPNPDPLAKYKREGIIVLGEFTGNGRPVYGPSQFRFNRDYIKGIWVNGKYYKAVNGSGDIAQFEGADGPLSLDMSKVAKSGGNDFLLESGTKLFGWGPSQRHGRYSLSDVPIPGAEYTNIFGRNPKSAYEPMNWYNRVARPFVDLGILGGGGYGIWYGLTRPDPNTVGTLDNTVKGRVDTIPINETFDGNADAHAVTDDGGTGNETRDIDTITTNPNLVLGDTLQSINLTALPTITLDLKLAVLEKFASLYPDDADVIRLGLLQLQVIAGLIAPEVFYKELDAWYSSYSE